MRIPKDPRTIKRIESEIHHIAAVFAWVTFGKMLTEDYLTNLIALAQKRYEAGAKKYGRLTFLTKTKNQIANDAAEELADYINYGAFIGVKDSIEKGRLSLDAEDAGMLRPSKSGTTNGPTANRKAARCLGGKSFSALHARRRK